MEARDRVEAGEAVSGVEAISVGRSVVVSPLHTTPSRALASVVASLARTGGLCARAGGAECDRGLRFGFEHTSGVLKRNTYRLDQTIRNSR